MAPVRGRRLDRPGSLERQSQALDLLVLAFPLKTNRHRASSIRSNCRGWARRDSARSNGDVEIEADHVLGNEVHVAPRYGLVIWTQPPRRRRKQDGARR